MPGRRPLAEDIDITVFYHIDNLSCCSPDSAFSEAAPRRQLSLDATRGKAGGQVEIMFKRGLAWGTTATRFSAPYLAHRNLNTKLCSPILARAHKPCTGQRFSPWRPLPRRRPRPREEVALAVERPCCGSAAPRSSSTGSTPSSTPARRRPATSTRSWAETRST
jgi:hypothetical protein